MADLVDPTTYIPSYTASSSSISFDPSELGLLASGTNYNDMKEFVYNLLETTTDVYSDPVNATGVSPNMVITRNYTVTSNVQMRKTFTITFLLDLPDLTVTD